MNCYGCKKDKTNIKQYELKKGGKVAFCLECENDTLIYHDFIKRECLIDGVAYELNKGDRKEIQIGKRLKERQDEEKRLFDNEKLIFYFNNESKREPELNYQALKYMNGFLNKDDHDTDHMQRMLFNHGIGKHWYIEEWKGLTGVNVYIDSMSKEHQRVRKNSDEQWRERVRKWYSGRFECDESLYNCTFGFSQYDNEPFGDVYASYEFICSKKYDVQMLVNELINREW